MSKQSTPVRLAGLALILASLTLGGAPPLARAADAGLAPNGPASVTEFYVDRSDDANANACTSANPNDCTLRGAIVRVNTDGVLNATIRFSDTISQIDLTTALPALTTSGTYILGGFQRVSGSGMAFGAMMTIDASNVMVEQLRFVNGINQDLFVLSGSGNVIRNNSIGTPSDVADTCVSAGVTQASDVGIFVGPLVAGSIAIPAVWIYENDISCHDYGILIHGADGVAIGINHITNAVARNYIGTNWQNDTLGNGIGIALTAYDANGARYNQISNNWIYNSRYEGVSLYGTGTNNLSSTASNLITGNRIRGNGRSATASGIRLQNGAYYNRIGGSAAADRNFIFNNVGDGIRIESSNSNGILGNTIGSDTGPQYNNTGNGIRIDAGEDNWIGGLALVAAAGNDIGGNDQDGIALTNGTRKTTITRNLIGSDEYGVPRPNGASGISIQSGSYSSTIGTGSAIDRNVIAGNALHGIRIDGATTTSNTLRYNDIGLNTDPSLTGCPCTVAVPNGGYGLVLQNNAHHNRLDGANYIAYNGSGGVWVLTGAHDNLLGQDPVSGVANDEIFANTGSGILFSDAQYNLVRRASIHNNSLDGIEQNSLGSNNSWISTTTYSNGGLGIDIATTANDNIPTAGYPVITSVVRVGGVVTITGTSDTTFFSNFANYRTTTVYLLHSGLDPSGYGEGESLAGSANTNASGVWRVVYAEGATPLCYAAYKRVVASNGLSFTDADSEFSLSTCTPKKAYVPRVVR